MADRGIDLSALDDARARAEGEGRTAVIVAIDGQAAGLIVVADPVKPEAAEAVRALTAAGIESWLVTGDHRATAEAVARQVGIPTERVLADVLPGDKAAKIAELQAGGRAVAMIGDGINDAPALAQADLGVAIGTGADVAIEASDVTLVGGDPRLVASAIALSRRTVGIIRQNLFWAFAYNVVLIPVAMGVLYPAFGITLNPAMAAGAMALSSVSVVTNSLRLRGYDARPAAVMSEAARGPMARLRDAAFLAVIALLAVGLVAGVTAVDRTIEGSALPIRITARDLAFSPAEIHIPAGRLVSVELVNEDPVRHDWMVEGLANVEATVRAGGTTRTRFLIDRPGPVRLPVHRARSCRGGDARRPGGRPGPVASTGTRTSRPLPGTARAREWEGRLVQRDGREGQRVWWLPGSVWAFGIVSADAALLMCEAGSRAPVAPSGTATGARSSAGIRGLTSGWRTAGAAIGATRSSAGIRGLTSGWATAGAAIDTTRSSAGIRGLTSGWAAAGAGAATAPVPTLVARHRAGELGGGDPDDERAGDDARGEEPRAELLGLPGVREVEAERVALDVVVEVEGDRDRGRVHRVPGGVALVELDGHPVLRPGRTGVRARELALGDVGVVVVEDDRERLLARGHRGRPPGVACFVGVDPEGTVPALDGQPGPRQAGCRPGDRGAGRPRPGQSVTRRKTATAFWPPKPNPLIITVSTRLGRATLGT